MDYEKNNFRSSTPAFCTSKVESVNGTFLIERSLFLYDIDQKMYGVLMENFLHEINHLVNSKRHTIFKKNGIWYLRDGISVTNLNVSMTFGKMIDESFNVMQTADIFNELLKFSKFNIEDPALAEELKKLRYFPKSDGKGYELTTPLIKPLYKNPNFRYVLNRQKMEGNIQLISREFDSKTHPNAYNELSNALENIGIEIGPNCFTEGIKVKSLVKEYLK